MGRVNAAAGATGLGRERSRGRCGGSRTECRQEKLTRRGQKKGRGVCGKSQKKAGGRRRAEDRNWPHQMEQNAADRGQKTTTDAAAAGGTGLCQMRWTAEDAAQLLVRGGCGLCLSAAG